MARRKQTRRKKSSPADGINRILSFVAIALGILVIAYLHGRLQAEESATDDPFAPDANSLMTVVIPDSIPSTPVAYTGFSISFNPALHIPNYVVWELTDEETRGKHPRKDNFRPDENVAGSADTYDYLYSGYDRGHMAPAADMKWDSLAMDESFFMTNMCPQAKSLNTGAWKTVEEKCRTWAQRDSALIIIAGPVLNPRPHEYIGDNRVAVPRSFFKVILAPYANPIRAIAFHMPNGYIKGGMQATVTSVDNIEALTGLDFFSALPDSIEDIVEAQSDLHAWNARPPRKPKQ